jgi:hypothetical protein
MLFAANWVSPLELFLLCVVLPSVWFPKTFPTTQSSAKGTNYHYKLAITTEVTTTAELDKALE